MLHIMVVDDEAPIRDWLVYCIQKCEAASSVTSAVNGEEAYRRILEQKPNVVFTDIRMPGMDGLELMSKVRDILPFTVFIILTNYAEFSYAKQAISLGAREYILKSEMRSSDIQRIVAEIAATTAKIRSEKVHDVLQDGVVDLYEMYRNFEQPGAVAAFWQRQGLRPSGLSDVVGFGDGGADPSGSILFGIFLIRIEGISFLTGTDGAPGFLPFVEGAGMGDFRILRIEKQQIAGFLRGAVRHEMEESPQGIVILEH